MAPLALMREGMAIQFPGISRNAIEKLSVKKDNSLSLMKESIEGPAPEIQVP